MFLIGFVFFVLVKTDCEESITYSFENYRIENNKSYEELFNEFDLDNNNCIDSNEMNILLKTIGVYWHCRWPEIIIDQFDTVNINRCLEWDEFVL
jgi:Ca2+-binding EF-hand superfamily protein